MKLETDTDGRVIVSHDARVMTGVLSIAGIAFLVLAVLTQLRDPTRRDRIVGSIGAFVTCAVTAVLTLENSRFEFDAHVRTITWRRRWAFSRREGVTSFDQVRSIQAQRPIGDDGTPSWRLALKTKDGSEIPLTQGYRPDPSGQDLAIGERLKTILGLVAQPGSADEIQELVTQGRIVDAIKVMRHTGDVSLEEAKDRIEAMRRKRA